MNLKETPKLGNDFGPDLGMLAALALAQAFLRRVISHAVESLGAIEIKILPREFRVDAEETLYPLELWQGILDQLIPVDYQNLSTVKHLDPAQHVQMIHADGDGSVGDVHTAIGHDGQILEGPESLR